MKMNPYLMFNGQCEEAFKFYEQCLGGKIEVMMKQSDMPGAEVEKMPPERRDKIMHARLTAGDWVLMGSDTPPEHYEGMKGCYLTLNVDDPAEAERLFNALVENGSVEMPLEPTFWAERFGMLADRFGIKWMVNCEKAEWVREVQAQDQFQTQEQGA
ncbi:hypothetical protein CLG96_00295 [Sphingomonas oleivorans]|uniref:Glyoxalase/fosfomycin resistance/dioxygenase domain-containing protein n=1 Tax=Sphingomonas oleivorans TaxID=1735121 RepID=A0A2T5G0L3_9SPHN|nr:VOC family protein [Sphingomonas oleivorans]PTQ12650.1 hypothetical protein CLG96_00295 [Sphingomonas oleivorans]